MLVFGVVAAELSLSLYRVAMEQALTPLGTLLAFANSGDSDGGARAWGGGQSACGHAAEGTCCDQDGAAPRPRQPTRDSSYAAQLRRAAPIVRLFAAAAPGGEKEAAYHALVRLAAAADAVLGAPASGTPITPGVLYRDLARQGTQQWRMSGSGADAPAFNARLCAELDRRDVAGT